MASVILNNLKKTYPNGFQAVHGADFTIRDGEFIVLVGPSGCGKSTLLRMIAGLEDISEGTLSIDGQVVNTIDPADRDIAMVFQNYALYPHMSVAKNMAYGLKNRKISKAEIEKLVARAAQVLNLTEMLDRKPSQLSGGQRQRVAMGRAIVRNPKLFLFDEPLSNLDAKLRGQMRIEIRRLQRELGVTSVYVTHDQVEAMTMADRIVVLNGGRIEQIGTPAEIYHRPASTFVASFMGAPPMNLLAATAAENGAVSLGQDIQVAAGADLAAGRKVTFGLRPEDVALVAEGGIPFDVQIVEELGANRLLHGQVAAQPFTVSVPKDNPATTGRNQLLVRPETVHLFADGVGARI
ncbi:sn-glycerol-3-phosphate import ATP-binding protein UgpC [Cognatishimia sp. SS12]|uniref:sn-glycerol-3-phosphate import ATP-binding protein UgpC n=1 Tax=Cognatishimia sp. SS12 TaxID=2979465 RepID=UPI00232E2A1B|nr:sn-glycerol-3-phosphate import ATP-binding protein UgpC [Cognatishimia sp. SS12]MDC0738431.1 sn-glycerol-3-phosphate import ATP-binding protein UgpC [Cognatishimia sp. SS12]